VYCKTGYAPVPGSFWYDGVPDLMRDLQDICNASVRALVRNMSMSSGPQIVINDIQRLPSGEKVTEAFAHKIWQFVNYANSQLPALDFFQPKSNANELLGIYNAFSKLADDFTGIPAYVYGNERAAGAGRTAMGLSMLMTGAARGIKKVIARIDQDLVEQALMRQFELNMLNPAVPEDYKGDVRVKARGILALIVKEQMAQARMEFLRSTANPVDLQIIGVRGRANLLRAAAAATQIPESDILPSDAELRDAAERVAKMDPQEISQKLGQRAKG
jgi:hypothetical protein